MYCAHAYHRQQLIDSIYSLIPILNCRTLEYGRNHVDTRQSNDFECEPLQPFAREQLTYFSVAYGSFIRQIGSLVLSDLQISNVRIASVLIMWSNICVCSTLNDSMRQAKQSVDCMYGSKLEDVCAYKISTTQALSTLRHILVLVLYSQQWCVI